VVPQVALSANQVILKEVQAALNVLQRCLGALNVLHKPNAMHAINNSILQ